MWYVFVIFKVVCDFGWIIFIIGIGNCFCIFFNIIVVVVLYVIINILIFKFSKCFVIFYVNWCIFFWECGL